MTSASFSGCAPRVSLDLKKVDQTAINVVFAIDSVESYMKSWSLVNTDIPNTQVFYPHSFEPMRLAETFVDDEDDNDDRLVFHRISGTGSCHG